MNFQTFSVCKELPATLGCILLSREAVIHVKASYTSEEAKVGLHYPRQSSSKPLHEFTSDAAMTASPGPPPPNTSYELTSSKAYMDLLPSAVCATAVSPGPAVAS